MRPLVVAHMLLQVIHHPETRSGVNPLGVLLLRCLRSITERRVSDLHLNPRITAIGAEPVAVPPVASAVQR